MISDKKIVDIYLEKSQQGLLKGVYFDANDIVEIDCPLLVPFLMKHMQILLENRFHEKFMIHYFCEFQKIFVLKMDVTMKEICISFVYEDYDKYFDLIDELNQIVSSDGMLEVFANNVYYQREAGIFIRTSENFDKIEELVLSYGLTVDYSKGLDEISKGMREKQYNVIILSPFYNRDMIESTLRNGIFQLPPRSAYEKEGYGNTVYRKPKLFVSYCHKNQDIVQKVIKELRNSGLDFWIDEEQIDIGDNIIEKIDNGMSEADIPIIFISQATKESLYAKFELRTFLRNAIYSQSSSKPWFVVKLDDVDLDEIIKGMNQYKYFEYKTSQDIGNLSSAIKRKLKMK